MTLVRATGQTDCWDERGWPIACRGSGHWTFLAGSGLGNDLATYALRLRRTARRPVHRGSPGGPTLNPALTEWPGSTSVRHRASPGDALECRVDRLRAAAA